MAITILVIWGVSLSALAENKVYKESGHDVFFNTVKSLCGKTFKGQMTYPLNGQDAFEGKVLTAYVTGCSSTALSIPFEVGDDASRTWQLSNTEQGLQFKHEHRHDDGSFDEVTNYGGYADVRGDYLSQSFPADEFTQKLIPAASTNVWSLSLSPDLKTLTYHLERHQKPRFTAVLKLVEP